jgi:hypothetical protein
MVLALQRVGTTHSSYRPKAIKGGPESLNLPESHAILHSTKNKIQKPSAMYRRFLYSGIRRAMRYLPTSGLPSGTLTTSGRRLSVT